MPASVKPNSLICGVDIESIGKILESCQAAVTWTPTGLTAKIGEQTTELVVAPPPDDLDDAQAIVRVRSRLSPFFEQICRTQSPDGLNALATLGAVTPSGNGFSVESRLTIFQEEKAWNLHLPLLVASVLYSHEAITEGFRGSLTNGAVKPVKAKWNEKHLIQVHDHLSQIAVCHVSEEAFTAEFGLEEGAISALTGSKTALFQLSTEELHPAYGPGLFCSLTLPQVFDSPQDVLDTVERLNTWESQAVDAPPHFGAWCSSRNGRHATYICFLPDELHAIPGLATNVAVWQSHRAERANQEVQSFRNRHNIRICPKREQYAYDDAPTGSPAEGSSQFASKSVHQKSDSHNATLIRLVRTEVGYGLSDDKLLAMAQFLIGKLQAHVGPLRDDMVFTVIQATRQIYPSVLVSELERVVTQLQKRHLI